MSASALNKAVREIGDGKAKPRMIRVGGVSGLGLSVRKRSYGEFSTSWVLRRTHEGKRRDFALGGWPDVTLAQARERARIILDQFWRGEEPATKRRMVAPTFREAAKAYFERSVRGQINSTGEGKWFSDLETFA
jgi:hypothetical protein